MCVDCNNPGSIHAAHEFGHLRCRMSWRSCVSTSGITSAAALPAAAEGQAQAVAVELLKQAMSTDQAMTATLLQSLQAPQPAGVGGSVNTYA